MQWSPGPPTKTNDRLTGQVRIYHERFEEDPVEFKMAMASTCNCTDEAYDRKIKVSGQAVAFPLPFDDPSMVIIKNVAGSSYKKNPSEGEINADSVKVVRMSFDEGETWPLVISPRRFTVIEPATDWKKVRFRCDSGETELRINVVP